MHEINAAAEIHDAMIVERYLLRHGDELFEAVRGSVSEVLGSPLSMVRHESLLVHDLGADSLDYTMILAALEDRFNVTLDLVALQQLVTGSDAVSGVRSDGARADWLRWVLTALRRPINDDHVELAECIDIDTLIRLIIVELVCKDGASGSQCPAT